ncbi:MAG TPA: OB-fold domain-containing protein [Hyphomicrobiales bacterium]|nr:OB-fold domain-containing protein [Hyphomicrobiales bacterium]
MTDPASPTTIDWSRGVPLMAGPYFVGLYQPSPETAGFWDGVGAGELRLRHCRDCGGLWHPKRIVCTDCSSLALDWQASSGSGRVYSFSEVHRAATPAFAGSVPYTIGLVRLDEGVHLFARLIPEPGPVAIDAPARVDFRTLELGQLMPVFLVGGV